MAVPFSWPTKWRRVQLYRLQSESWLARKDITAAVRLSPEHLSELLAGVAKFRLSRGFAFPFPDDAHFIQLSILSPQEQADWTGTCRFPLVVDAEAAKWARRWEELREWVRGNAEAAAAAALRPQPRRRNASSRRNSHRSSDPHRPQHPRISVFCSYQHRRIEKGIPAGAKAKATRVAQKRKLTENGAENGLPEAAVGAFEQFLYQRFAEKAVLRPADVSQPSL